MSRTMLSLLVGCVFVMPCGGQEKRMTPELLWKLGRLDGAALNQTGNLVAYTVQRFDLEENSSTLTLYVTDLGTGEHRTLVRDWKAIADLQFGPSPFGERLYFVGKSEENEDEVAQVWAVNPLDGGQWKVTRVEDGVANLKVSPAGTHLACTIDVKLDQSVTDLYKDLPKADARIIDSLMFRHWNAWHDYKFSHLHIGPIGKDGRVERVQDLMDGIKADCPVPPFGEATQFAWAPDGSQIAYTTKLAEDWAQSTDSDIYLVSLDNLSQSHNISEGMDGYDTDPVYSPDGKYLAFHSMERPGFEADRNRIMIYDRASRKISEATAGLDQTANAACWQPDGSGLYFVSETRGTDQIFRVPREGGGARQISNGRYNWSLIDLFSNGGRALVSFMNTERPAELAIMSLADGKTDTITTINDELYAGLELPTVRERWVRASDGKKIHCWVIYPPGFDPRKKWPMLTYCQGGPQSQVGQWFSYRWNFHLMAANGYVVLAPNRRGLPGFGQEWNEQISRDWGGQAMQDLLSATDDMLKEDYINRARVAAVGASFGGYTVYWMMGHHQDRFCTMIAHAGVFNLESMYGSTEELFFVDWDLGGPYWKDEDVQADYHRFSPHRYVGRWKTPLLVIHGEQDFRVPVTQGIEAFTAAQVQGVPSRFLYFPAEGHWVLGPQNGVLWYRVFFDWLDHYCRGQPNS